MEKFYKAIAHHKTDHSLQHNHFSIVFHIIANETWDDTLSRVSCRGIYRLSDIVEIDKEDIPHGDLTCQ